MAATNIGKTKRSTDDLINDAVNRQQDWLENRRAFTRKFLQRFNVFEKDEQPKEKKNKQSRNRKVLRAYWFPITCALVVILIAVFVVLFRANTPVKVVAPSVPEPVVRLVPQKAEVRIAPSFDMVRIEKDGNIMIAGRGASESNISIMMNKKIVATEHANTDGEFVYAPKEALKPGKYVISLIDTDKNIKSANSTFVYIPERGYKN